MKSYQLNELIDTVLKDMGKYSKEAADLLMVTSAQESFLGEYIKQLKKGPARGIFQMEPDTEEDIFRNYLKYRPELMATVQQYVSQGAVELDLWANLPYQIAIARVHYLRVKYAIPKRPSFPSEKEYIMALAEYWKKHWNTPLGKGTAVEAYNNYMIYVDV